MNSKILTLLGFAAKAGKLSFGMEAVKTAVKTGRSRLVIVAEDISEKSRKEIRFFTQNKEIEILFLKDISIQTVSAAVGRKCGIISVNDNGFADALKGGNANDK